MRFGEWAGVESGCICKSDEKTIYAKPKYYCALHPIDCELVSSKDSVDLKKWYNPNFRTFNYEDGEIAEEREPNNKEKLY